MDLLQKTADAVNKVALQKDKADVSSVSTESLTMSLLGQIQSLEEERDNARLLAARMRERLEHVTSESSDSDTGSTNDVNYSLTKLLREVNSNIVNDLQQIVLNEEQRQLNLKQIACCGLSREGNCESESQSLQDQISLYKEHYEKLLEEAESEKVDLRKKLKRQQDLVLDKDLKIKELSTKLNTSNSLATGNI